MLMRLAVQKNLKNMSSAFSRFSSLLYNICFLFSFMSSWRLRFQQIKETNKHFLCFIHIYFISLYICFNSPMTSPDEVGPNGIGLHGWCFTESTSWGPNAILTGYEKWGFCTKKCRFYLNPRGNCTSLNFTLLSLEKWIFEGRKGLL